MFKYESFPQIRSILICPATGQMARRYPARGSGSSRLLLKEVQPVHARCARTLKAAASIRIYTRQDEPKVIRRLGSETIQLYKLWVFLTTWKERERDGARTPGCSVGKQIEVALRNGNERTRSTSIKGARNIFQSLFVSRNRVQRPCALY